MLADATRVQVLWALVGREMSVNELAEHVGKPAPSVSQHLAKLRMARLVRTRREGTTIFYSLENDHVAATGHRRGVQRRTRRPRASPAHHRDARGDLRDGASTTTADHRRGSARAHDDHDHAHAHDHGTPRPRPRPRWRGGTFGALREVFAPHSHDAADSIDDALESSAAGIRAVKISLRGAGRHRPRADRHRRRSPVRSRLLADTIHNFSDALTAIPLWIAFALGHQGRDPPLHLRLRPRRRPGRAVRRRDDHAVGRHRRSRGDPPPHRPRAHRPPRLGRRSPVSSGSSATNWSPLPHPRRPADRLGRAGRRRPARPDRRIHLPGGAVRRRRCRARASRSPTRSSAWSSRWRSSRCCAPRSRDVFRRLMDGVDPELVDTAETGAGRRTRCHGGAQREDALDRSPPACRRRTRRRPRDQPARRAPHRPRRRTHTHPRRAEAVFRTHPRLPVR